MRPAIPTASGRWWTIPAAASPPASEAAAAGAARRQHRAGGGVYISDDAGATWKLVNSENRLWGRGWYFEAVTVDPTNPDRAYVINTATYMTTDAGKTFVPIKGAPGGDDYHQIWVNPKDGNRMVLSSDQGTVVSVDGGKSWSTWYNQPTAQIYHVAADNRFPYWLYGAQQDSGGVGVSTWSREGVLIVPQLGAHLRGRRKQYRAFPTPRTATSSTAAAPGAATRPSTSPRRWADSCLRPIPTIPTAKPGRCRRSSRRPMKRCTTPISSSCARATAAAPGKKSAPTWRALNPPVPATLDPVTAKDIDQPMTDRFGVVYTIGPSPLQAATVWVGTDDGLIHVTRDDGKNWNNVTPPAMTAVEQGLAD